jgi:hypothetical protein
MELRSKLQNVLKEYHYRTEQVNGGVNRIGLSVNNAELTQKIDDILNELMNVNAVYAAEHLRKRTQIDEMFKALNVNTYEYVGKKMEKRGKKWYHEMMEDALKPCPREYQYTSLIRDEAREVKRLLTEGESYRRVQQAKRDAEADEQPKMTALYRLASRVLPGEVFRSLSILKPTRQQLEDLLSDTYIREGYGRSIGIDENVCECETYEIGSNRCSCGNRRISLSVGFNYVKTDGKTSGCEMYYETEAD